MRTTGKIVIELSEADIKDILYKHVMREHYESTNSGIPHGTIQLSYNTVTTGYGMAETDTKVVSARIEIIN